MHIECFGVRCRYVIYIKDLYKFGGGGGMRDKAIFKMLHANSKLF